MHKYLTKFHFYTTLDFEETIEVFFLICNNVYDGVTDFEVWIH